MRTRPTDSRAMKTILCRVSDARYARCCPTAACVSAAARSPSTETDGEPQTCTEHGFYSKIQRLHLSVENTVRLTGFVALPF